MKMDKINRGILTCAKFLYLTEFILYAIFSILSIYKLMAIEASFKNVLYLLDLITLLAESYFVFYFFSQLKKAFDIWTLESEKKESLVEPLKKIVRTLYIIAVFDALLIFEKYTFGISHGVMSEGFYESAHPLAPFMKFVTDNKPVFADIINYLVIRPTGISTIVLALLISQFIRIKSKSINKDLSQCN